jgi:peptidoglycan/xylan/chitin deacetylase (PgdA/CDA1 family)
MLELLIILTVVAAGGGLAYLLCYGGIEGPVDWAMHTVSHGDRDRRVVALTFDDGPDPGRTPALLETLRQLDCPATFFCLGANVDANPELARRIVDAGHELGNHTYTHRYLPATRRRNVEKELALADRAISRATGTVPTLARPPWGGRSPWTVRAFRKLGKRPVLWDVNSFDWKGEPPEEVARRVLDHARPGSIVLMHDGGRGGALTVEAVQLVVPALRARGYTLMTVSEILADAA